MTGRITSQSIHKDGIAPIGYEICPDRCILHIDQSSIASLAQLKSASLTRKERDNLKRLPAAEAVKRNQDPFHNRAGSRRVRSDVL